MTNTTRLVNSRGRVLFEFSEVPLCYGNFEFAVRVCDNPNPKRHFNGRWSKAAVDAMLRSLREEHPSARLVEVKS